MEDDAHKRKAIKEYIEIGSNYEVETVDNKQKVIESFSDPPIAYILDVNMGEGRSLEGIDVLEVIKEKAPRSFTIVYSALIKDENEVKREAGKIGADFIFDKTDLEKNCEQMVAVIHYHQEFLEKCYGITHSDPKQRQDHLERLYSGEEQSVDRNMKIFEEYQENDAWRETHYDKYVAFIDGKMVDLDKDRSVLLNRLRKRDGYENEDKLIVKVRNDKNVEVMDEPTSLWLDFL
jgi:DNA-binding response OmpR family regulator